jgi:hypothetical protein
MPTSVESSPRSDRQVGCYVYGILPHDVEVTEDSRGIGDRDVRLIRHGEIAALVSEIPLDAPIGKPEDLAAHQRLLDSAAVEAPVLPIRFGAVLASTDAVTEELLADNHDEFLAALRELEGKVEYLLKVRYEESAVLREILSDNQEAARLREELRGLPGDDAASRNIRIRLGELVNEGITATRAADTRTAIGELGAYAVASAEREPTITSTGRRWRSSSRRTRPNGSRRPAPSSRAPGGTGRTSGSSARWRRTTSSSPPGRAETWACCPESSPCRSRRSAA